jgi:hypothetical protein
MKYIRRLFVHSGSSRQASSAFALITLLVKLDVVYVGEMVDARPLNLSMGAT